MWEDAGAGTDVSSLAQQARRHRAVQAAWKLFSGFQAPPASPDGPGSSLPGSGRHQAFQTGWKLSSGFQAPLGSPGGPGSSHSGSRRHRTIQAAWKLSSGLKAPLNSPGGPGSSSPGYRRHRAVQAAWKLSPKFQVWAGRKRETQKIWYLDQWRFVYVTPGPS